MNTILKLLFLLLITSHGVEASVIAKVDSKKVELGEMVTYSLTIVGEDVTRPNIQRLCDNDVISTSSQTNMQIINGKVSKSYTLSYKFVPQKSCKIEPLEIEINSKLEASNAVEIEVVPVSGTKDSDFALTLSSDKKELFVGEAFDLTLTFKQKSNAEAVDSKFTPPELKGFWVKSESKPQRYEDAKYIITKIIYTMAPQRAGELIVTKAQMQIASRSSGADSWGAWIPTIKWKTYFSNELTFDVKPLPSGVTLAGSFSINATVDKTQVDANEPANVTIEVQGSGNLEDIKSFKPNIDGVAVFDEKIVIDGAKLTQKITFVAEGDFVIPSFSLNYFDTKTRDVKTVSTKEIALNVKNSKQKESLNIQREVPKAEQTEMLSTEKQENSLLFVLFLLGLVCGILIMIFKGKMSFKREQKSSPKEPKTLLMRLLPFKDDAEVKEIIENLEKNIYSNQNIQLDKKVLNKIKNRYKIL
ncbi:MAG: BatD family protein [Sulfurimonas sp.]|uniref:BatD family protein n=1 Tax=Sulfurimonas sp. TaxID=2022749 RepID=UPI00263262E9|nr:BatD family protein [Sulfurimonas sp.]MDD5373637.1 BatD family protein [Sulfurimonas sp.]